MTFPIECNPCFGTGKVPDHYSQPPGFRTCPSCNGAGKHRPLLRCATIVDAERYRWLREHGSEGIYVLQRWMKGDEHSPLALAQGAELDTIIDEYLTGKRREQSAAVEQGK